MRRPEERGAYALGIAHDGRGARAGREREGKCLRGGARNVGQERGDRPGCVGRAGQDRRVQAAARILHRANAAYS